MIHTYSLWNVSDGDDGFTDDLNYFEIVNGNELHIKADTTLDFETKDTFSFEIQSQDAVGTQFNKAVTITVNDVQGETLVGVDGAVDNLIGGIGEDSLTGSSGEDYMIGGAGVDTFYVSAGDTESASSSAYDTIDLNIDGSLDILVYDTALTISSEIGNNGIGSYSGTIAEQLVLLEAAMSGTDTIQGEIAAINYYDSATHYNTAYIFISDGESGFGVNDVVIASGSGEYTGSNNDLQLTGITILEDGNASFTIA